MSTAVRIGIVPKDAIEVLKAYDKSEWAYDFVSMPTSISNVIDLGLRQDGNPEPVTIRLFPDGTWEMSTRHLVAGDRE